MHVDLQAVSKMWKVWFVHFAERIRCKLAPFTSVYLLANDSRAKVPFHHSYQCCVALAFLGSLCATSLRYSEIK